MKINQLITLFHNVNSINLNHIPIRFEQSFTITLLNFKTHIMKAIHLLLTSTAFLGVLACTEKKETIHETTTIEKDTIIVQEQNDQDPVENNTEKTEDGTSVSINKDGVEFSTKSGENSTEVELKNKK